jgi:hypothetical protein
LCDGFVGQFALCPLGDRTSAVFGRLAGQGHDLTVGFGANSGGRSGARGIRQTVDDAHLAQRNVRKTQPAPPPMPGHVQTYVELAGDFLMVEPLLGQQDNSGPQNDLLRGTVATHQGF